MIFQSHPIIVSQEFVVGRSQWRCFIDEKKCHLNIIINLVFFIDIFFFFCPVNRIIPILSRCMAPRIVRYNNQYRVHCAWIILRFAKSPLSVRNSARLENPALGDVARTLLGDPPPRESSRPMARNNIYRPRSRPTESADFVGRDCFAGRIRRAQTVFHSRDDNNKINNITAPVLATDLLWSPRPACADATPAGSPAVLKTRRK